MFDTTVGALQDLNTIVANMDGASNNDWFKLAVRLAHENGRIAYERGTPYYLLRNECQRDGYVTAQSVAIDAQNEAAWLAFDAELRAAAQAKELVTA